MCGVPLAFSASALDSFTSGVRGSRAGMSAVVFSAVVFSGIMGFVLRLGRGQGRAMLLELLLLELLLVLLEGVGDVELEAELDVVLRLVGAAREGVQVHGFSGVLQDGAGGEDAGVDVGLVADG
ncbi:MAG TPA: hypothetical protein VFU47_06515, partial [Armatimonadota bacterium]|nr:hypothetical protein [Armatimonadota bacterium]